MYPIVTATGISAARIPAIKSLLLAATICPCWHVSPCVQLHGFMSLNVVSTEALSLNTFMIRHRRFFVGADMETFQTILLRGGLSKKCVAVQPPQT